MKPLAQGEFTFTKWKTQRFPEFRCNITAPSASIALCLCLHARWVLKWLHVTGRLNDPNENVSLHSFQILHYHFITVQFLLSQLSKRAGCFLSRYFLIWCEKYEARKCLKTRTKTERERIRRARRVSERGAVYFELLMDLSRNATVMLVNKSDLFVIWFNNYFFNCHKLISRTRSINLLSVWMNDLGSHWKMTTVVTVTSWITAG